QDLPLKVDVIDHLPVVGLGAAFEQQADQLVPAGMRRAPLLAFAYGEDQGSIVTAAADAVRIRIGAVIEQQPRDLDGVVVRLREWQTRGAEEEQRLPVLAAEVAEEIVAAAWAGAVLTGGRALGVGELWPIAEKALHL